MSKMTILDEVLVAFESLGKSQLPTWQIYSQVKKIREQHNQNVGDFDCLKSYIHWSILDNSGGRGANFFTMRVDGDEESIELKLG